MRRYRFWSFVVGLSLLAIVGGVAASLKYRAVINQRANEELAAEVAKVQACGEPLTGGELNAYYQLPKDRPDMTAEILAALVPCELKNLGKSAENLPIIGRRDEIPHPPQKWSQLEEAEEFLAGHHATLKTFDAVYRRRGMARYPVDFREGIAAELTGVQSLRNGTLLLSLQFHVALHKGRMEQACDSILTQVALAHTLDGMPLEVAPRVREAIFLRAIDQIILAVKHLPLADENIVAFRDALAKVNIEDGWRLSIIAARGEAFSQCLDLNASPKYVPRSQSTIRANDAALILRVTRELKEAIDTSLAATLETASRLSDELEALDEKNYPVTKMFIIGLPNMPRVVAIHVAHRDTANLLLASEQFRRKHGNWPDNLEQCVPEFIAAVPDDPFSKKPYCIAVTNEEFKVYSYGDFKRDNGGDLKNHQFAPDGDIGFALPVVRAK
jgi:hypothetical protein